MLCSISGTLAIEPVFNTKTRKIYDKKTLESFAIAHPEEMGELVPVANNPFINPKSTSIPALLVQFQNEWDALATELYQVKQQLYDTRTQLSTALYENDAAKRVVARLIKEKDDAVNRLLSLAPTTVPEPVAMDVDVTVLDSSVSVKIDSTFKILKEARMKRKAPDTYATLEDISSLKLGEPISTSHNSGICF